MLIELREVDYDYSGPYAPVGVLRQVNLQIKTGEFLALIGSSGAGKSTLLAHLNALLRPSRGSVLYRGQDIHAKGFDTEKLRRSVGMLFQYPENNFFGQTVFEDVAFGPRNMGKKGADLDSAVAQALDRVDIPISYLERSPFTLSGGEKRRVALAGILAMEPEVVVLDEPTAGLDIIQRENFISLMRHLHKQGITIIMVTHEMEQVCELASRVIVLDNGRIVVQGPTREVMTGFDLNSLGLDQPDVVKLGKALMLQYAGKPVLTEWETLESILERRSGRDAY